MPKKHFQKHHHYYLGFVMAVSIGMGLLALDPGIFPKGKWLVSSAIEAMRIVRPDEVLEHPVVAISPNHESILVWEEKNSLDYDIYATRLDAQGSPLNQPFRVNQYAVNDQKLPRIASDAKGNFVVVWQSYGQDGSGAGIYGQRFAASGDKVGSEFKVNNNPLRNQMLPDVAMNAAGYFAVTWVSEYQNDFIKSVYAQLFNPDGTKNGEELRLNQNPLNIQTNPAVAVSNENKVFVVWQNVDKASWSVRGRVLEWATPSASLKDILISPSEAGTRTRPRAMADAKNQFVAVWQEYVEKEEYKILFKYENIKSEMISAQGALMSAPIDVTPPARFHQENPEITPLPEGAMVVWQRYDEKKDGAWSVMTQRLDASAKPVGDPERMMMEKGEHDWMPAVGSNAEGEYGILWSHRAPSGSSQKTALYYKSYFTAKAEPETVKSNQSKIKKRSKTARAKRTIRGTPDTPIKIPSKSILTHGR